MAHLCGLCMALRGDHGQLARAVTNYDGLLVSVLTEAQAEDAGAGRRTAGPCPLRGMRTASVAHGEGARLAAAVSLVLASAKVRDHVADRDGLLARRPVALAARRELGPGRGADRYGRRVRHGRPGRRRRPADRHRDPRRPRHPDPHRHRTDRDRHRGSLRAHGGTRRAGVQRRAVHLLDAVEDRETDAASGAWNPLTATGTPLTEARRLADDAVRGIRLALREVAWGSGVSPGGHSTDGGLAHRLLVHELPNSVDRAFDTVSCAHGPHPYAPPGAPGTPGGPGGPVPPGPPRRRGLIAGCAVWVGLFCTCQLCCGTHEDPWTGERKQACFNGDCSGCCDCCECCSCCGEGGGCDCGCDC
ncbi:hypothetical protein GCM10027073_19870 [Streptomyces chlorus]